MKRINLILGLLILSMLFSCSRGEGDEPTIEGGKIVHNLSVVNLSLGADISAFSPEVKDRELRVVDRQLIQFEIKNGNNKFIVGDNGKNTNMPSKRGHLDRQDLDRQGASVKFLVQIRKKSSKTIVGSHYGTWDYKSRNTNDWRLNGQSITLSGVTPGVDALQVRVVSGGDLDASAQKITISKPEYQVLDLSKTHKVSFPVPFASDWMDLSYDASKSLYVTPNDARVRLKPLGVLLVTTVRSSMSGVTSLTGVRYVSNALAFQGEFTLDGSDKIPFKAVGGHPYTTDVTRDTYYTITYNFGEQLSVGRTPNDKVIVSWGLPTGKPQAVVWQTENDAWQSADLAPMISQPQTHVYAEGVQTTSSARTNYALVPIMGTNHNFEHGMSFAVNSELYDVPRQLLGYFAKYTVNKEGTGFDTSHDPEHVSLVNWKVAKDFLHGKTLIGADGNPATFKMGNEAMLVYTGNYFSSVWSVNQAGSYMRMFDPRDPSKGALVARSRPVLINYGNDETANIAEGTRSIMQVYIPSKNPHANYMIIGREMNPTEYKNRGRSRSKEQCVIRIEATHPYGVGKFPVGSTTLTSISLGKYFIGTAYSPVYDNKAVYDESLWQDPVFLQGRVQRKMPAAGYYERSSWNAQEPTKVADVDNLQPDNTKRVEVGKVPIYWAWIKGYNFMGTGKLMQALEKRLHPERNGAQWLSDESIFETNGAGNILYYPHNAGATLIGVNRDAKYMWQALWPIANKYQGDDPD